MNRPGDDAYFVAPWSDRLFQGDLFAGIPLGFPFPPDAVTVETGIKRYLSGPFEAGPALLLTPTCAMAAQGAEHGYGNVARTLVPIRPLTDLLESGVLEESNLGHMRSDRLVNYMYLPASESFELPESAALLYLPMSLHHDVINGLRAAQMTGEAYFHLRFKLAAYFARWRIEIEEPPPAANDRTD